MILPFDRGRLVERNRLDEEQELEAVERTTSGERLAQALELSDLVRALALGLGHHDAVGRDDDLEDKARLYVEPLRLLSGR
jgi:hypothetical protein